MKAPLLPVGDAGMLVAFGNRIDPKVSRLVQMADACLRGRQPKGIVELVPAYATLLIHYDPLVLSFAEVRQWAEEQLSRAEEAPSAKPRKITVPVRYGGLEGPDLPAVAALHHLTIEETARVHAGRDYTVYMMGFTPGFPYMGILEEAIDTPRLQSPRTRVPAGSVGIAGRQTGIYPIESPGGWQLIGRTSMPLFDPHAEQPFAFAPGDTVRFVIEELNV
jgi:inhibitor of KinA